MAQGSTRKWVINSVLIVVTLSFLGISIAPLIGSIIASTSPQPANNVAANSTSEKDRVKIQIEGFEAVLKREPKNQTALTGLVELRLQSGDLKGALEPMQTLAEINPDKPVYRLVLARTQLQLNDTKSAQAEFRKVLTTNPGELEALQRLVGIELQASRPEAAIGILQTAIDNADTANKIKANSVDKGTVMWILGELYRTQKRYTEASGIYEKMTKENAKDFRPLVGKAQIKRSEGKEEEAVALFAEATKVAPAEFKDEVNKIAEQSKLNSAPNSSTKKETSQSSTDKLDKTKEQAAPNQKEKN